MLVWRFEDSETVFDKALGNMVPKHYSAKVNQIADMSVFSFLKIIAQIKKSHYLDKISKRRNVARKIHEIKLGFGLHCGWAIEGAIGSDFKIDASYLSPNVNLASRINAATN